MVSDRRSRTAAVPRVSLKETLVGAGLDPQMAQVLEDIPHRVIAVDPRRPFREPGAPYDEVLFVRSGIVCKYQNDGSGRRQIVALRFPGEGILPRDRPSNFGIQAVVRSELMVASAKDFNEIVAAHPKILRFFWKLLQRNEAISYEWLVNCGRRDSVARVAHLLCETAMRSGIDVEQETMVNPFTQQQIADITGQTSVNVNRVFADLQRQGVIERTGREIAFRDWRELQRIGSFQPYYLD